MLGETEADTTPIHKAWLQVLEAILRHHLCLAYVVGLHSWFSFFSPVAPFMCSKNIYCKEALYKSNREEAKVGSRVSPTPTKPLPTALLE